MVLDSIFLNQLPVQVVIFSLQELIEQFQARNEIRMVKGSFFCISNLNLTIILVPLKFSHCDCPGAVVVFLICRDDFKMIFLNEILVDVYLQLFKQNLFCLKFFSSLLSLLSTATCFFLPHPFHLVLQSLLLVALLHRLLLHLLLCLFLGRRNIFHLGYLRRILLGLEEFYFIVIEIIFFVFLIIIIGLGNAIVASTLGVLLVNLRVRRAIAALFITSSLVLLLLVEG